MFLGVQVRSSGLWRIAYGAVGVLGLATFITAQVLTTDPFVSLARPLFTDAIIPGEMPWRLAASVRPAMSVLGLVAVVVALLGLIPAIGAVFARRPFLFGGGLIAAAGVLTFWFGTTNVVDRRSEANLVFAAEHIGHRARAPRLTDERRLPVVDGVPPLVPLLLRLFGGPWVGALGFMSAMLGAGLLVWRGAIRTAGPPTDPARRQVSEEIPPVYALTALGLCLLADPLRAYAADLSTTLVGAGLVSCAIAAVAWGRGRTAGVLATLGCLADWTLLVALVTIPVVLAALRDWRLLSRYLIAAGITWLPFAGWYILEYANPLHVFHLLATAWTAAATSAYDVTLAQSVTRLSEPFLGLTVPLALGVLIALGQGIYGLARRRQDALHGTGTGQPEGLDPPALRLLVSLVVVFQLALGFVLAPLIDLAAGVMMIPLALALLLLAVRPFQARLQAWLPLGALLVGANLMLPMHSYASAYRNAADPLQTLVSAEHRLELNNLVNELRRAGQPAPVIVCDNEKDAWLVMANLKLPAVARIQDGSVTQFGLRLTRRYTPDAAGTKRLDGPTGIWYVTKMEPAKDSAPTGASPSTQSP